MDRYQSGESEIERLRSKYLEIKEKRKKFKFHVAYKLKFPLAWTLFFSVIGIIQESIIERRLVFFEFFGGKYLAWFASFGNFAEVFYVGSAGELLFLILRNWYYFFFTGGLIALLWATIYVIVFSLSGQKKHDFNPGSL